MSSDSDDSFFDDWKEKRLREMKEATGARALEAERKKAVVPRFVPKQFTLSKHKLEYAVRRFSIEDEKRFVWYKNRGCEINAEYRNNGYLSAEKREEVEEMSRSFLPIGSLFGEEVVGDRTTYVKVCRMQTKKWDDGQTGVFISTSNKCMPGFGGHRYTLLVSMEVPVGVVKLNLGGASDAGEHYEIILDPLAIHMYELEDDDSEECGKFLITARRRDVTEDEIEGYKSARVACF